MSAPNCWPAVLVAVIIGLFLIPAVVNRDWLLVGGLLLGICSIAWGIYLLIDWKDKRGKKK